jgi:hypothetical protein
VVYPGDPNRLGQIRQNVSSLRGQRSVPPQTAYVFTRSPDDASRDGCCAPAKLLGRIVRFANRTLLDDEFDAGRELLSDVEAARPLSVIPIEAIPTRPVTRSGRWALLAAGFATPHVLLAVDDAIRAPGPTTQIGAAGLFQNHAESLHETPSFEGNLRGAFGQ